MSNPHHETELRQLGNRYVVMALFQISVINHTFSACDSHELPSAEEAGKQGIRSALAIGVEEVTGGESFFGAEIRIEEGDKTVRRFMVSVGATPLQ